MRNIDKITAIATQTRQERLRFLKISNKDLADLQEVRDLLLPHLPNILNKFYDHLRNFPEISAVLGSTDQLDQLKQAQIAHWTSLLSGVYDEEFFERAV
jgi:methyl-accepting chemotaxis protein